MFEFIQDMFNYEERKVARFENKKGLIVDTAAVSDSAQPYETGIVHPAYNGGKWVIVELYDSKKAAQIGHKKWVKKMTARALPKTLKDVSTAGIATFLSAVGDDNWRTIKKSRAKK